MTALAVRCGISLRPPRRHRLAEAIKERKLTKTALAALMGTSRTQVDRMLDPTDGNVTIETLQRAAAVVAGAYSRLWSEAPVTG
jgi:transcriptional regulator with XRE-family HTH domain